jgi:MFS family permease
MTNALTVVYRLLLGVWLGTLVFVSVSAPVVFRHLAPDRKAAGDLVGKLLGAMSVIGWITMGGALLALTLSQVLRESATKWGWLRVGTLVLMLLLLAVYQFGIVPQIESIGDRTDFSEGVQSENRDRFNALHDWSTRIVSAIFLLGLGIMVVEVYGG